MAAAARPQPGLPTACWCCGEDRAEAELVRLGTRPEVGICLDCARWVKRRATARRHQQHPSLAGRVNSGVDRVRHAVIARGWHERGAVGAFLRRIDRWLP